jgi:hypothetical protein
MAAAGLTDEDFVSLSITEEVLMLLCPSCQRPTEGDGLGRVLQDIV